MTPEELRKALDGARYPVTFKVDRATYEKVEDLLLADAKAHGRCWVWCGPNGGAMFKDVELICEP